MANRNRLEIALRICLPLFVLMIYAVSTSAKDASTKPNILIVFTDDQGYGDLACYGNQKNKTPRTGSIGQRRDSIYLVLFSNGLWTGPFRAAYRPIPDTEQRVGHAGVRNYVCRIDARIWLSNCLHRQVGCFQSETDHQSNAECPGI